MDQNKQFGPYSLVKKLASGGMAEIYLARTGGIRGFEKFLVLKMIHPKWSQDESFISMLIEEAKLAVNLTHANIAQVFDLGLHEDTYYIAMEYVDGRDLFQVLVRTSELDTYIPFDAAAHIAEQIAAALYFAHTRRDKQGRDLNLIHRDISPQNVIISMNGEIKLIDFGIAKASQRPGHTQVGIIKGKFYYMSPEQAWGKKLDHRTDTFSLGICLHEMLTGQMLYAEDDQLRLLEKVRAADIPRPSTMRPGIPPDLEAIVMRALAKDANDRFQTAFDFQRALSEYLHRNSPGFTPTRVARMMWDLFPERTSSQGGNTAPNGKALDNNEFAAQRPPDSVIFDLKHAQGSSATSGEQPHDTAKVPVHHPTPPPVQARGRREATKPVKAMSSNGDDEVFTSDKKGKGYTHKPSHPPPPLAGQPRPMARSQQPPDPGLVDATHMMSADALSSAASNPAFAAKGPGVARPRKASGPPPAELAPEDRTMMFNPNDMGSLTGAPPPAGRPGPTNPVRMGSPPPSSPGVASRRPLDPVDDGEDKTAMFDPSKFMPPGGLGGPPPPGYGGPPPSSPKPAPPRPSGLRKATPAPAAPKAQEPEEHTTLFDPSKLNLPPEIAAKLAGGGGGSSGQVKAKPRAQEPVEHTTPARPADTGASDKPMTREEKIAAAKARAKGGDDLASRVKKKKAGGGDKPMTREEKIAAAKARAKGGDDLASRIKKKGGGGGDGKPMTREEKIAAAKARAKGGADLKDRIKKKAPAKDSDGGDDKAERIKLAKAKAKERSGQSSSKGPKKVSQTKGNANARFAGRKSTIMGVDAESGVGKVLKVVLHPATLGVMGLFFIGGCIGLYAVISKVTAPPPPKYGTIEVTSVPNAANIEYDGVDLGAKTPYVIDQVEAGTLHSIRISSDNYTPQIRNNVTTEPGQMTQVHIVLEPSPGTLILGSVPDGAEIVIDGRVMDVTPCIIKDQPRVDNAFIQVTAKKEGFQDATATLKWVPGETEIKHTFDLEPVGDQ